MPIINIREQKNLLRAKHKKIRTACSEEIRNSLDINHSDFVVGHVGRFNPQKNHGFIIDVFNEIYKKNNKAKLILVGTGNGQLEIINKVNNLGLTDNVLFLGNRSDVNRVLQAMDVFLFPSLY